MIDHRLLLSERDDCIKKLERKGVLKEEVLKAYELTREKNRSTKKVEKLRHQKNLLSKEISVLMSKKQGDQAHNIKKQVIQLKISLEKEEKNLSCLEQDLENALFNLPNFPDDKAPEGLSSKDNVEILRENFDPDFFDSKEFVPHWKIMEELNIFDQKRAGKITGSMFAIIKGTGAKLLRSLLALALDLFEEDYTEWIVPSFVNRISLTGTGQLPKFANEAYHIEKDDLWAIPTGEVPLTALHRQEILEEQTLPLKYMTYTPCFRREAGAAGLENRGLQRLHEFHKVELVKICKPEQSKQELESLLQDALKPIKLLELPYRVLDLCARDLTFSSARTYDIEVYSPGTKSWVEVSSVGLFTDYQSRRSQIRYREGQQIQHPHTLNGSGLATPRVLSAILENYRTVEGKVKIPQALIKYMGSEYL